MLYSRDVADRERTTDTRERVLQAGIDLWIETPPADLFGGLNVSRLSKRAGITRATFYTYWGTTQEFLDDLLDHIVNREPTGFSPDVARAMERLTVGDGQILDDFILVCAEQISTLAADPALRVRFGQLAKIDDPVVAEKLRAQYHDLEARMGDFYTQLLDRWGRAPRAPLEQRHNAAIFTMLMEAFAARHAIDPDNAPTEVYAWASLALLFILTARRDDHRDMRAVSQVMNRFNEDGDRIRQVERRSRNDGVRLPARTGLAGVEAIDIARQARQLLSYRPWREVTVEEIAGMAGTTPSTVLRLFGSKHGLAVGVLQLLSDESFAELPALDTPIDRVRAMIGVTADLLQRSPALTQSAVLVFAGEAEAAGSGVLTWDPTWRVVEAVREADAAGQLHLDVPPEHFTAALFRTLLTQHNPVYMNGLGRDVDAVELLLRGAGAPPADQRGSAGPGLASVG